jgi:hypothetical protein
VHDEFSQEEPRTAYLPHAVVVTSQHTEAKAENDVSARKDGPSGLRQVCQGLCSRNCGLQRPNINAREVQLTHDTLHGAFPKA